MAANRPGICTYELDGKVLANEVTQSILLSIDIAIGRSARCVLDT